MGRLEYQPTTRVKQSDLGTDRFKISVDEGSAEEMAIDDRLPVSTSRTAKWWFSIFHLVAATVGAGVLSLPHAISKLGWGPGVTALVISWIVTLYTSWQMAEMHEMVPAKRFRSYDELAQHAFGKIGSWIVVPMVVITEVGADIVYMITAGQSLGKFYRLVCGRDCKNIKLTYFIMISGSVQFLLSQLPSFDSIGGVSLAATAMIMCISYSTIAWVASVEKGVLPDVQYGYKSQTTAVIISDFISAFTIIAFAYGCPNFVMEIQASMPSTPDQPSKRHMWRGVIVAYIIVALCYFPVALIGFWTFGNAVDENILLDLERPIWLIAMANLFVMVQVTGAYQAYAMPFYNRIETLLVMKYKFRRSWYLRFIVRNTYVAFTMFMGITFPFFDGLLGVFGGFGFAPTTYILPCVIWLAIRKPKRFGLSWFANWVCVIYGVFLLVIGPTRVRRDIILQLRTYQ